MTTPKSTRSGSAGHWLKSALANPVVVIIEAVLKTASRTACSPCTLPSRSSAKDGGGGDREQPEVGSELLVAGEGAILRRTIPTYSRAKFVPAAIMNSAIVRCVAGANASMERASVENPPVPSVVNECATAR